MQLCARPFHCCFCCFAAALLLLLLYCCLHSCGCSLLSFAAAGCRLDVASPSSSLSSSSSSSSSCDQGGFSEGMPVSSG